MSKSTNIAIKMREKKVIPTAQLDRNKSEEQSTYPKTGDYLHQLNNTFTLNSALFQIFGNYFNIIKQDVKGQKSDNIKEINFISDNRLYQSEVFLHHGQNNILCKINDLSINLFFNAYRQAQVMYYELTISSVEQTYLTTDSIYEYLLNCAIKRSNLKGKYITMDFPSLSWKIDELASRSFSDIFLPSETFTDIKLYDDVYKHNQTLMRYLLVGVPGSGKTESALILMNEMKRRGVTIFKMAVDDCLPEKIQLAEVLQPSLIILDDIDLKIGSRSTGGYNPGMLSIFLDVLDGANKIKDGVGIIATTNSSELLDLAAQRPGRFEKVVIFDDITKDNIKNIILKSLKYEFSGISTEECTTYTNQSIVDSYYSAKVTGAYVYNSIKVLKLNADANKIKPDTKWILNAIKTELKVAEKVKNSSYLNDKFDRQSEKNTIGFKPTRFSEVPLEVKPIAER